MWELLQATLIIYIYFLICSAMVQQKDAQNNNFCKWQHKTA